MGLVMKGISSGLVLIWTALFVPSVVAANITIEPRLEDPASGIFVLIVTNFSTDLLLISLGVYVAFSVLKKKLGDISDDPGRFVASILVASALVTVAGGVIDFVFLYEKADDHYALRDLSLEVVFPAAVLIFATIAASLYAIAGVQPKASVVIALAVAPLSPLGWWFMNVSLAWYLSICAAVVVVVLATLALVLIVKLYSYHIRVFSDTADRTHEGGQA